ncbi:MAG: chemotaxis response regulator protein-glutamate methylesterase [Gammaproteobacteria bacterium]|nr:chemotaxis response regulator protein-glutamate methylesterase [Gammaproteobacteria bacterium]
MSNIKVLVIDDSAVVRQVLGGIISDASGMEVVDTAQDPIFALQKLEKIKPDVITLDVEMPRMDGLTFLKKLMQENPIPVVMCSTLTQKSSDTSVKALHLGALEIVGKPTSNLKQALQEQKKEIVAAIRTASKARLDRIKPPAIRPAPVVAVREKLCADAILPKKAAKLLAASNRLIAIGASTGGTQALEYTLSSLNTNSPGVVIVQHMPEAFTESFAKRLDSITSVHVKHAEDNDLVETGKALIAPGGKHMIMENRAGKLYVRIKDGPLVSRHQPSVDVLFRSVAQTAAKQTLGIIMTGMGDDGATGMKEMFDAGAFTVAQDEESCVIFGMPAVAIERGGVRKIASLQQIPDMINAFNLPVKFKEFI